MQTLYRIIDCNTNTIVAEHMTHAQARETLGFYQLDYPTHTFEIESYTQL